MRDLLTVVDCYTQWLEAFPLLNIEAVTWVWAIIAGWISCFGSPRDLTADQGSQFTSASWRKMNHLLGISLP